MQSGAEAPRGRDRPRETGKEDSAGQEKKYQERAAAAQNHGVFHSRYERGVFCFLHYLDNTLLVYEIKPT